MSRPVPRDAEPAATVPDAIKHQEHSERCQYSAHENVHRSRPRALRWCEVITQLKSLQLQEQEKKDENLLAAIEMI